MRSCRRGGTFVISPRPLHQTSSKLTGSQNDWEASPRSDIQAFQDLPSKDFGVNQHLQVGDEFKEALRQILWQFKAPIRYAFAYGSGVFPQSTPTRATASLHPHPDPAIAKVQGGSGKMIDFVFGVTHTQHWHSLNLQQHRSHYSGLRSLGSSAVSHIQDDLGAGLYFHPFVTVNGTLIKYGVVNLETLCRDLAHWDTLYLAGRLQKPVKILRDDPKVRLANQVNLISALRTALLLLPASFSEHDLYNTIAGISYLGDPRMSLGAENLHKVSDIVQHQLPQFRHLYAPLVEELPNVHFANARLQQDLDPQKRANMVRRLPKVFREKLYFQYQTKFEMPRREFAALMAHEDESGHFKPRIGGPFERRIAADEARSLTIQVSNALASITKWPSYSQSIKGLFTAGTRRSWRYAREKWQKNRSSKARTKLGQ